MFLLVYWETSLLRWAARLSTLTCGGTCILGRGFYLAQTKGCPSDAIEKRWGHTRTLFRAWIKMQVLILLLRVEQEAFIYWDLNEEQRKIVGTLATIQRLSDLGGKY